MSDKREKMNMRRHKSITLFSLEDPKLNLVEELIVFENPTGKSQLVYFNYLIVPDIISRSTVSMCVKELL